MVGNFILNPQMRKVAQKEEAALPKSESSGGGTGFGMGLDIRERLELRLCRDGIVVEDRDGLWLGRG